MAQSKFTWQKCQTMNFIDNILFLNGLTVFHPDLLLVYRLLNNAVRTHFIFAFWLIGTLEVESKNHSFTNSVS